MISTEKNAVGKNACSDTVTALLQSIERENGMKTNGNEFYDLCPRYLQMFCIVHARSIIK